MDRIGNGLSINADVPKKKHVTSSERVGEEVSTPKVIRTVGARSVVSPISVDGFFSSSPTEGMANSKFGNDDLQDISTLYARSLQSLNSAGIGDTVKDYIRHQNIDELLRMIEKDEVKSLVEYPNDARGDINAFKYIQFLDDPSVTIIVYDEVATSGNNNLHAIVGHLTDDNNPKDTGHKFYVLPRKIYSKLATVVGREKNCNYKSYDDVTFRSGVKEKAQLHFSSILDGDHDCKAVAESLLKQMNDHSFDDKQLMIVNLNTLGSRASKDMRQIRHVTDMDLVQAQIEAANEKDIGVMLVGGPLDPAEKSKLQGKFVDATQMWDAHYVNTVHGLKLTQGLGRWAQRAAMYGVTQKFKNTVYMGMQSGANEDAMMLHNTNVISLSENVGTAQAGLGRVKKRSVDSLMSKQSETESTCGGFYSLKADLFLTGVISLSENVGTAQAGLGRVKKRSVDSLMSKQSETESTGGGFYSLKADLFLTGPDSLFAARSLQNKGNSHLGRSFEEIQSVQSKLSDNFDCVSYAVFHSFKEQSPVGEPFGPNVKMRIYIDQVGRPLGDSTNMLSTPRKRAIKSISVTKVCTLDAFIQDKCNKINIKVNKPAVKTILTGIRSIVKKKRDDLEKLSQHVKDQLDNTNIDARKFLIGEADCVALFNFLLKNFEDLKKEGKWKDDRYQRLFENPEMPKTDDQKLLYVSDQGTIYNLEKLSVDPNEGSIEGSEIEILVPSVSGKNQKENRRHPNKFRAREGAYMYAPFRDKQKRYELVKNASKSLLDASVDKGDSMSKVIEDLERKGEEYTREQLHYMEHDHLWNSPVHGSLSA